MLAMIVINKHTKQSSHMASTPMSDKPFSKQIILIDFSWGGGGKLNRTACPPLVKITRIEGKINRDSLLLDTMLYFIWVVTVLAKVFICQFTKG